MTRVGRDDIVRLFGSVADHTAVEIIAIGANLEDLELASLHAAKADDLLAELRKPLTGKAARVYDIVMRDPHYTNEEELDRE